MHPIHNVQPHSIKCNFCTSYFKSPAYFANIQRHAVKVCPKCYSAFNFTVAHPTTYKLHKLLLLDTGICLPQPISTHRTSQCQVLGEIQQQVRQAKEEIQSKIGQIYEDKVRQVIEEMKELYTRAEQACDEVGDDYTEKVKQMVQKQHKEAQQMRCMTKLQQLKLKSVEEWKSKTESVQAATYRLSKSRLVSSRRRVSTEKSREWHSNKENHPPNMRVKNKVLGVCPTRKMLSSKSKQAKNLTKSVSSRSLMRASRKVDNSKQHSNSVLNERNIVGKLLNESYTSISFMPQHVRKEDNKAKIQSVPSKVEAVIQLLQKTSKQDGAIQLVGGDVSRVNFQCYLSTLAQLYDVKTLRMIRNGLVDADMDSFLRFLTTHPTVETLILTNNKLTELSVTAIRAFKQRYPDSHLKQVYLGNNLIRQHHTTHIVKGLQKSGVTVHL